LVEQTIREMADAEATRAEAENPDEEAEGEEAEAPAPEPEPEPEPEPPPLPEGVASVEQLGELEKATTSYLKRVDKIFGGEVPWPMCATCEAASDKETCDECAGFGGVLSGSKVPDQRVVRCERCKGAGYLVRRPVNVADAELVAPVVVALAEGNGNGEQAAALTPNDPGWEPWMGTPAANG
jgi:hypothetical protein